MGLRAGRNRAVGHIVNIIKPGSRIKKNDRKIQALNQQGKEPASIGSKNKKGD